ncbi:S8 family peptidase [Mesorhizobium sp. WSM2239]|uniref:S8 family peptidase n=2 Tax=unclassified Mesorhizobium TaxID=325217 RepID=A0AAU8D7C6_9HYPH
MAEPENDDERNRSHIKIDVFREEAAYEYPSRNQQRKPMRDDYAAHAEHLLDQLAQALGDQPAAGADQRLPIQGLKPGTIVEVETVPPAEGSRTKAVKVPTNLEFPNQDVVVLRSRRNDDRTESALLFVPDDARDFLRGRIENYGRDPGNQRRPDVDRFEAIDHVRAIEATALFTGEVDLAAPAAAWWELWVRQPVALAERIAAAAQNANIDVHADRLLFPDTTVLFLHCAAGSVAAFSARIPGAVMEIRRATGTIEIFLAGGGGLDQHDWVAELAPRVGAPPEKSPVVCTLDTGVAAAHPLIAPGLRGAWAYDVGWGADDHHPNGGHGTPLAGLILYGDLEPLMNGIQPVQLTHGVESMKLLPPQGFPPTKPPSYGVVTQGAVSAVEIEQSDVLRSFCLAISTTDFPPSRPSTWSGALDQIAAGAMHGEAAEGTPASERPKRLLVVATGNVLEGMAVDVLPCQSLEDPSQSWNAVTVGGITRKEQAPAPPPALSPAVPANHRSPFSRGSQSLPDDLTPIKPEVLFEAGNMLSAATGLCDWHPAVSLLAPGSDVVAEPLVPFWATSAAVGMAGNFVGQLQAALPDLWPETHRALTVDSARWPEPIRKNFIGRGAHWKTGKNATKAKVQEMLREVGYGVPDITRAIMSARNDATMIAQAEIQPYTMGAAGAAVFNEMHFYDLPWPKTALEQLENEIVTMKVTLSYFIEPNLTGKAATRPDTYRSFGLRFDMKKRGETDARFRSRVSASQEKDGTQSDSEQSYWLLGPKAVQAGSLHCDLWRGYAADLALHDAIAVYPVGGWWKSHAGQKRITDKARYALVISISAPGQNIDLYSEVTALVEAKEVEVLVG